MIGKIARSGGDFLGVLRYCKYERNVKDRAATPRERGELIYHQHVDALLYGEKVGLPVIAEEMSRVAALNARIQKPVCHVSLSFPPGEHPPDDILKNIVSDFAPYFGFTDNGLLAYRHTDTRHEHIHIIANRINASGRNTSRSSFDYLSMGHFCRIMEQRYGLQSVKQMDALKLDGRATQKNSEHHDNLRRLIDQLLPECATLHQLRVRLLKNGYKSVGGNGIAFVVKGTAIKIKGSELGRAYSRRNLIERLNGTDRPSEAIHSIQGSVTELDKLRALVRGEAAKARSFDEFTGRLAGHGYGIVTKQRIANSSGKPYTSILFTKEFSASRKNGSKAFPKVISGYQLGAEFTHAALVKRIGESRRQEAGIDRLTVAGPATVNHRNGAFSDTPDVPATGLEKLLTSTNAGRVEADGARSRNRIASEVNNRTPDLESRSREQKRMRKQKLPRRR
jgi:hypothetical protein